MLATDALKASPLRQLVAATSVGIVENTVLLDLAYEEDSQADVDMNLVMTEDGNFVELQATAERHAFPRSRLLEMMDYAETGIRQLHDLQRAAIAAAA
jgi:ribonuclease PH